MKTQLWTVPPVQPPGAEVAWPPTLRACILSGISLGGWLWMGVLLYFNHLWSPPESTYSSSWTEGRGRGIDRANKKKRPESIF